MISLEEFKEYHKFLLREATSIIQRDKRDAKDIAVEFGCSSMLIKTIQGGLSFWDVHDAIKIIERHQCNERAPNDGLRVQPKASKGPVIGVQSVMPNLPK
jgi:hypothetical protein